MVVMIAQTTAEGHANAAASGSRRVRASGAARRIAMREYMDVLGRVTIPVSAGWVLSLAAAAQPPSDRFEHGLAREQEVTVADAELAPQHRRTHRRQQQGADLGDHAGLPEVMRIALHHDARFELADGLRV